jgi:TonB-linked SusC/RagA family outer membrane protein
MKFTQRILLVTIFFFLLITISIKSFSQEQVNKITGKVTGSDKSPLVGATVKVKNRTTVTQTDEKGNFSINASPIDTLVVSYINYTTQYVRVGTKLNIPVILIETPNSMNEVIVIGYGNLKRKELTGVVGKVNMEDLRKAPVTSFDQALAGRIAGVVVSTNDGQPGSGSQIIIRGSSAGQDVSPLYVIDGFPVENMDLNSINTNDIESIEVLKDASSIAIYGARGANGVIIITTKKGKNEPLRISYAGTLGLMNPTKVLKLLSPYQFVKLQLDLDSMTSTSTTKTLTGNDRYINPTGEPNIIGGNYDPSQGVDLNYYKDSAPSFDWQKLVMQQGILQMHNLSIIGGSTAIRYAFSGSYTNQKGLIINTGIKHYDGKGSFDIRANDNDRFGASFNYANTTSYGTIPTGTSTGGVVENMWEYPPVNPLTGPALNTGEYDSSAINNSTTTPNNLVNPLQEAQNVYLNRQTKTLALNLYNEYSFTDALRLRITGGITNTMFNTHNFYNSYTTEGNLASNSNGTLYNSKGINGLISNTNNNIYLTEALLSYRKKYDQNHILDVVGGATYQYGQSVATSTSYINVLQGLQYLGAGSLGIGSQPTNATYGISANQLFSLLGRVNYSLMEKYIFTLTGRDDGSSKFAPGKQWGFFPSGAFAWRFTQENFLKKYTSLLGLGDSKFRASYGAVGNNRVNDYASIYQLAVGSGYAYPIRNTYVPSAIPYFPGNANITWETTYQLDLGTTLSFFKDRVLIDMDYYNKRTSDALLPVPLPEIAGYAGTSSGGVQYENAGVIRNRGFEFAITTTNIQNTKFSWTSSFNIAFNVNKILEFYNNRDNITEQWGLTSSALAGSTAWISQVGHPISQFYGYKWGGVYQYADFNQLPNGTYALKPGVPSYTPSGSTTPVQPGDPKYVDLNKDGVVDDNDRTIIGNPLPKHTGGFTNNFLYKNFSLSILFQWSVGQQILNANKVVFEGNFYSNSNQFAAEANHWTPQNPTNDIPRPNTRTGGVDPGGETRVSTWEIENGSYVRLKTVQFGYSLSPKALTKISLTAVRFFIAGQNLLTFTKYTGQDPEVSTNRVANPATVPPGSGSSDNGQAGTGYLYIQPSSGSRILSQGYDYTAYPRARTITVGAIVTF